MRLNMIIQKLKPNTIITKGDFEKTIITLAPNCSKRSMYWKINKLCQLGVIEKKSSETFYVLNEHSNKTKYAYHPSDKLLDVVEKIKTEFPLVDFQAWETIQFNEFLNHQIGKNVIFVDVEHMLEESVFNILRQSYPNVLCRPDTNTFHLYFEEEMIVIQRLVSEAPKPLESTNCCCLEKMLVDLFANKIIGTIIEENEYTRIYEDAFYGYFIDQNKLFRYARRRNKERNIRQFIKEKTNIHLTTED